MPDLPAGEPKQDQAIARTIGQWFTANARELPWRTAPRDPWISLMSEIMLQQTQVARVAERFDAFVERFPTPAAMASRPLDDVLSLWSGLGYYRRARMLHACAEAIVERHGGAVPDDAAELHDLPGVGRYTAGAVASIAFGKPEPLVDGNVSRVLLRLHGVELAADSKGVQAWAWQRATDLARAAVDVPAYSEGIMELGATICTPRAPMCDLCPVRSACAARAMDAIDRIPRPKARGERTPLAISAIVVTDRSGRVLLEQRPSSGLWAGLWQPPCVERSANSPRSLPKTQDAVGLQEHVEVVGRPRSFSFATTHRNVKVRVWRAKTTRPRAVEGWRSDVRDRPTGWFSPAEIETLGLGSAQRRMLVSADIAISAPTTGASRVK
ncbi:MAG: A/G-specific adenine glycosylase [Phycisphaerales bacterium JB064]